MTWEAWAVIIAAVITALGTIAATTYNDLVSLLRKPSRNVKGEWEAKSYRIDSIPPADESRRKWIGDYIKHPNPFTISSAMLTISPMGDHMSGYFVGNAGLGEAWPSFVGFTELRKRE